MPTSALIFLLHGYHLRPPSSPPSSSCTEATLGARLLLHGCHLRLSVFLLHGCHPSAVSPISSSKRPTACDAFDGASYAESPSSCSSSLACPPSFPPGVLFFPQETASPFGSPSPSAWLPPSASVFFPHTFVTPAADSIFSFSRTSPPTPYGAHLLPLRPSFPPTSSSPSARIANSSFSPLALSGLRRLLLRLQEPRPPRCRSLLPLFCPSDLSPSSSFDSSDRSVATLLSSCWTLPGLEQTHACIIRKGLEQHHLIATRFISLCDTLAAPAYATVAFSLLTCPLSSSISLFYPRLSFGVSSLLGSSFLNSLAATSTAPASSPFFSCNHTAILDPQFLFPADRITEITMVTYK